MMNEYYANDPDPAYDRLKEDYKSTIIDEARNYLLSEYNCNVTHFNDYVVEPHEDDDFWATMSENNSVKQSIDDAFADEEQRKRQRMILGSVTH